MKILSVLQYFHFRRSCCRNVFNNFLYYKHFSSAVSNCRAEAVNLSYSVFQPESKISSSPVIILHGLLGSKQNWRGLAKSIAKISGSEVYTLDARNHGDSPHTENFSYKLMAEDVKHFMSIHKIPQAVIIGHSMGGRTAMTLALTEEDLVSKLVVVDVSPNKMPKSATSFIPGYMKEMKEAVNTVSGLGIVQARHIIDKYLATSIPESGIRQFLLTNLMEKGNSLSWKPNLEVLLNSFSEITEYQVSGCFSKDTLFICGEISPYVKPEDYPYIRNLFPNAQFIVIPEAFHWVHSEKPAEFLESLRSFL